jgi:23S rRNA (cytosine1962-C5)-methyltransferase
MDTLLSVIKNKAIDNNQSIRMFHGRGRFWTDFEDVNIDWYPPVVVVTLYEPREQSWLDRLSSWLVDEILDLEAVVVQERFLAKAPWRTIYGQTPDELYAREDGLTYRLRLGSAQNIGFFPDMACGRRWVREQAQGKRILNLFAYSCSFSVAALAGGACQVVNLDMNRGALELGRQNHELNGLDRRKSSFLCLELFRSFSKLKKMAPYDLIICDPPLAQGANFQAHRDWPKLIRRFPELLDVGGQVLCCVSSPEFNRSELGALFTAIAPQAEYLGNRGGDENFPDIDPAKGTNLLLYRYG